MIMFHSYHFMGFKKTNEGNTHKAGISFWTQKSWRLKFGDKVGASTRYSLEDLKDKKRWYAGYETLDWHFQFEGNSVDGCYKYDKILWSEYGRPVWITNTKKNEQTLTFNTDTWQFELSTKKYWFGSTYPKYPLGFTEWPETLIYDLMDRKLGEVQELKNRGRNHGTRIGAEEKAQIGAFTKTYESFRKLIRNKKNEAKTIDDKFITKGIADINRRLSEIKQKEEYGKFFKSSKKNPTIMNLKGIGK